MSSDICHDIAARAATQLVTEAVAAGLDGADIAVAVETVVAISVAALAKLRDGPNSQRFAQEMIETITERAHVRVQAMLRGEPPGG